MKGGKTIAKRKADILSQADGLERLVRPRISALLEKAVEKPLVVVCAGAGCGKTRAVSDFTNAGKVPTVWLQFSEYDNAPSRFWESFVHMIAQLSDLSTNEFRDLGFPDSEDKMNQYISIRGQDPALSGYSKYLIVLDDLHLIVNADVAGFIERFIYTAPANRSVILISRENPPVNIAALRARGDVYDIDENDLNFTEQELSLYLDRQGAPVAPEVLREIYEDINGWAFSVNLVARSLKKSPGYSGFVRSAMKKNIHELMEAEVFDAVSEPLKRLLVRLSLIEHLSADLVETIAGGDEALLAEFRQQNAYIRYDIYMHVYLIHHLFLDFLRAKQAMLTEGERRETYRAAAVWCEGHGYVVDALDYYEEIGDYGAIVKILTGLPFFLPYDLAFHMAGIFRRAPEEAFSGVDLLAVMHLRTCISQGQVQEAGALFDRYEQKFLRLPESDPIRKHTLGLIYYLRGLMRFFMSTTDGQYDFDAYFAKMDECMGDASIEPGKWLAANLGPWLSGVGADRQGPQERYAEASVRMIDCVNRRLNGIMTGLGELGWGEAMFYTGDDAAAKHSILIALESARGARQFESVHRALLYLLRIAFAQGKYDQAKQALNEIKALLEEKDYVQRSATCDIAQGWYYCALRQPDLVPGWLKEKFSPYGHAFFPENFGNQIKARYHYLTKNFAPLLAYMEEMKRRESILFGRAEMLAMEACVLYQMRDRQGAFAALRSAFEKTSPFGIQMPFEELGKDMRTLTASAIRDPGCGVPKQWLETVNKRASVYARYQSMIISDYERETGAGNWKALSPRETEVLHDLCDGLSRSQIAAKRNLSLSTINMNVQSLYTKLHAGNTADVIRIAVERKLV